MYDDRRGLILRSMRGLGQQQSSHQFRSYSQDKWRAIYYMLQIHVFLFVQLCLVRCKRFTLYVTLSTVTDDSMKHFFTVRS